jgi:cytochrome c-type biogenesis protein CcmH/NrfG
MLWLTLFLLLASLFIFLWHPHLKEGLSVLTKIQVMGGTTLLALGLYLYKGSPDLPDHPFFYIEKMSAPAAKLKHQAEIPTRIQQVIKNPTDYKNWQTLGDLYHEGKHYYESALHYREAWRLNPSNRQLKVLYTQGLVLFYHGKSSPTTRKLLAELKEEYTL